MTGASSERTARIRELPITGIVGPSGVGKSSFIRAGVGPALKGSGEHWEVVTLRPGRQPLAALASIVQKLTTRSLRVTLAGGSQYCFSVRARDRAGNVGPWGAERCTSMALDDRSLSASSGWSWPSYHFALRVIAVHMPRKGL